MKLRVRKLIASASVLRGTVKDQDVDSELPKRSVRRGTVKDQELASDLTYGDQELSACVRMLRCGQ